MAPPGAAIEIQGMADTSKLKTYMEKFGEVTGCHIGWGGKPVVRFRAQENAEAALRALKNQQFWLGGSILNGDWQKDTLAPGPEAAMAPPGAAIEIQGIDGNDSGTEPARDSDDELAASAPLQADLIDLACVGQMYPPLERPVEAEKDPEPYGCFWNTPWRGTQPHVQSTACGSSDTPASAQAKQEPRRDGLRRRPRSAKAMAARKSYCQQRLWQAFVGPP